MGSVVRRAALTLPALLGLTLLSSAYGGARLVLSTGTTPLGDQTGAPATAICVSEFGIGSRTADWADVVSLTADELSTVFEEGLQRGIVTRDGAVNWQGKS